MWSSNTLINVENVPRLDEKAKEILRKLGETYGNNYTDPKSAMYHNPDLIPSKSKIQKEIKSQGVKASSRTISRYLLEGIERAKGSQLASQIFCQIWTDRERLSPEVKEYIRQKGESYTKQYLNPASKMCKNPDEIPSIKQIKKELTENNIDVNAQSISKYLREGTNRVVSQDVAHKIFQEMWPGPNRLEKDQCDAIRLRGENIARQYTDPTSHLYQNKDVIPSIYQIRKEFAAQGIHAENSIFSKYLQEGIVRATNPVQASLIFRELRPDPKITELKPEYQEIIRQRGEFYAKEYLNPSSEISQYPDKIPPLSKIQQELRDQGILSERHTISKYLKEGVERATGSDIAPQVFRDMWAKNTKLTPEVQFDARNIPCDNSIERTISG